MMNYPKDISDQESLPLLRHSALRLRSIWQRWDHFGSYSHAATGSSESLPGLQQCLVEAVDHRKHR